MGDSRYRPPKSPPGVHHGRAKARARFNHGSWVASDWLASRPQHVDTLQSVFPFHNGEWLAVAIYEELLVIHAPKPARLGPHGSSIQLCHLIFVIAKSLDITANTPNQPLLPLIGSSVS